MYIRATSDHIREVSDPVAMPEKLKALEKMLNRKRWKKTLHRKPRKLLTEPAGDLPREVTDDELPQ